MTISQTAEKYQTRRLELGKLSQIEVRDFYWRVYEWLERNGERLVGDGPNPDPEFLNGLFHYGDTSVLLSYNGHGDYVFLELTSRKSLDEEIGALKKQFPELKLNVKN